MGHRRASYMPAMSRELPHRTCLGIMASMRKKLTLKKEVTGPFPLPPASTPLDLPRDRRGAFMPPEQPVERRHREATTAPQLATGWSIVLVMDRIEEAYDVLRRTPMNVRPRAHSNSMPAYVHEFTDLVFQNETGEYDRLLKTRNEYQVRGATSAEIARMEAALAWPMEFLRDKPEVARAVGLGALWAVHKVDVRKRCKAIGMDSKVHHRRRLHGLKIIALGLHRRGERS
jgi:hypothetical protein